MSALVPVLVAADVTEAVLAEAWEIVEGWYLDRPVDWENVWDRLERGGYDLGSDLDSPAMRKIKRTIGAWKREATS